MPVIVAPGIFEQWLDPALGKEALLSLLKPCPEEEMEVYPVGLAVNKPANNGPNLIERIWRTRTVFSNRLAICPGAGPFTYATCLLAIWRKMERTLWLPLMVSFPARLALSR